MRKSAILKHTAPESHSTLLAATEKQDEIFADAFQILNDAIAEHAFPATSVAITYHGRLVAQKAFGTFIYAEEQTALDKRNCEVKVSTQFDLASLTKVLATTAIAMALYERGALDVDAPVRVVLPEFILEFHAATRAPDPRRHNVTMRMLLAHSSGLPAYEKLFLSHRTREDLLRAALALPLAADPGSRAEYSDIGFILLGVALERIAGESLDAFYQKEISAPLGMKDTRFNPPLEIRPQIAPTADEENKEGTDGRDSNARNNLAENGHSTGKRSRLRGRIIQGEVQDENAFALGGVAGHAGLFSTAGDVAKFAHAMLHCGAGASGNPDQLFQPETIALFTHRQSVPSGTSRALGWDTPSQPSQSGKYFSPESYGHLGYTGTSLWIDPVQELSITLLTNRTWPDCSNQSIKEVRPRFHDAVVSALRTNYL